MNLQHSFTIVNSIAVFGDQWYCGLYKSISLITLLSKQPTFPDILSIGLFYSDMQMVLADKSFSNIRYLFFRYAIYVTLVYACISIIALQKL